MEVTSMNTFRRWPSVFLCIAALSMVIFVVPVGASGSNTQMPPAQPASTSAGESSTSVQDSAKQHGADANSAAVRNATKCPKRWRQVGAPDKGPWEWVPDCSHHAG